MNSEKTYSKNFIHENLGDLASALRKAGKLAIVGVGSDIMQDDKAGVDVSLSLEKKFGQENPRVRVFTTYTTPENFTKDIMDFRPDHIVIVDAADLGIKPGEIINLPIDRITDFSVGTHKLSLVMMIRFLKETFNPSFSVIAIQYKSIELGEKMTREVKFAVKKVTAFLSEIIEDVVRI